MLSLDEKIHHSYIKKRALKVQPRFHALVHYCINSVKLITGEINGGKITYRSGDAKVRQYSILLRLLYEYYFKLSSCK